MQPKKSKKKKKKKTKASAANAQATVSTSSPDVDLAPAAAAARLAAPTPAKEVEQLTLASSTSVNGYHSHHSDLVNDHDGGHSSAHHSVDDLVMDHSDIKKWVMSVAACETVATLPEIRRYFHGRVEKGSCSVPLSPTNPLCCFLLERWWIKPRKLLSSFQLNLCCYTLLSKAIIPPPPQYIYISAGRTLQRVLISVPKADSYGNENNYTKMAQIRFFFLQSNGNENSSDLFREIR